MKGQEWCLVWEKKTRVICLVFGLKRSSDSELLTWTDEVVSQGGTVNASNHGAEWNRRRRRGKT
jgi:hypothetical protein